jgi:hypothetical protein
MAQLWHDRHMHTRDLALPAQGLIFIGWFVLDALKTTLGSVGFEFHFYEMAAIIANPVRLEIGIGDGAGIITIPFSILCLALVIAPTFVPNRYATAARFAPLALMLVCGGILYHIAQQDFFIAPRNASDITNSLVQLANSITGHIGDLVARHIGVGIGSWVASAGALLLAYTAVRKSGRAPQAA